MNLEWLSAGKNRRWYGYYDPAEDGEDAAGIITYGLAHVTDAAKNPELLLALRGVNSNSEVPLYLRGQFTNASAFTSGKIYRVLYSFTGW